MPAFSKIGMTGRPVSKKYGGLGLDMITYALAIEWIDIEGSSLRTFFSAHASIGQLVPQRLANEKQKKQCRFSALQVTARPQGSPGIFGTRGQLSSTRAQMKCWS